MSVFRSNWRGTVLSGPDKNNCYIVLVDTDKRGNNIIKPKKVCMNRHWLETFEEANKRLKFTDIKLF